MTNVISVLRCNQVRFGRRSRSRELASPRRHSFSEFRTRAGRVRLDLPEGPASGLRVRGGPDVALDLLDAGAAALEVPEVQVPIPADFLLDVTAPHFHRCTTEGNNIGEHEVIAVLSCFLAYDSPVCRVCRMDFTRSSGARVGLATRRCAGCARERSSGRFRAPHNVHYASSASFDPGSHGRGRAIFRGLPGRDRDAQQGRTDRHGDGQCVVHPADGKREPDPLQRGLHPPDVPRGTVPRPAGRERLPNRRDRGGPPPRPYEPKTAPRGPPERPIPPARVPPGHPVLPGPGHPGPRIPPPAPPPTRPGPGARAPRATRTR